MAGLKRSYWDWIKIVGSGFFGAALIFSAIYLFFASPHFKIREVEVLGAMAHARPEEIRALASVPPGKNLFFINLYEVGRKIGRHPWVDQVSVRRKFPRTLSVFVTEHTPVAILETADDGAAYYLNSEGRAFKKLEGKDSRDFPKITGFEGRKLEAFSYYYAPRVFEAVKFTARFSNLRIASLHQDEAHGYEAVVCREAACGRVFFGHPNEEKWKSWTRFVGMLGDQKWFRTADVHVAGKIFARM